MILFEKITERMFNFYFGALSSEKEWERWHNQTKKSIESGRSPKELTDETEIKYYSWLSDELISMTQCDLENILEVGCGSGALTRELHLKKGSWCTILDNTKMALDYASLVVSDQNNISMVCGDATTLPFIDSSYDFVHSVGLIEHFSDEIIKKMILEMVRVTKSGGYIYVAVPNYFSPDIISIWKKHGKGSERYMPTKKLSSYFSDDTVKVKAVGHSGFCFGGKLVNLFSPFFVVEKQLGKFGFGFLNFVLVQKR